MLRGRVPRLAPSGQPSPLIRRAAASGTISHPRLPSGVDAVRVTISTPGRSSQGASCSARVRWDLSPSPNASRRRSSAVRIGYLPWSPDHNFNLRFRGCGMRVTPGNHATECAAMYARNLGAESTPSPASSRRSITGPCADPGGSSTVPRDGRARDWIQFGVHYPPGLARGPLIDRPVLRRRRGQERPGLPAGFVPVVRVAPPRQDAATHFC